ncbi:unnamed protein product [Sphagnum balticum]
MNFARPYEFRKVHKRCISRTRINDAIVALSTFTSLCDGDGSRLTAHYTAGKNDGRLIGHEHVSRIVHFANSLLHSNCSSVHRCCAVQNAYCTHQSVYGANTLACVSADGWWYSESVHYHLNSSPSVIMDMLRYIRSRIPGAQEARKLERDEFFDFQRVSHDYQLVCINATCVPSLQTLYHGFPSKSCCMAYDSELNLLALATKNGHVRIRKTAALSLLSSAHGDDAVKRDFALGTAR